MTCPKECQESFKNVKEDIEGHQKTLYGAEGTGGVVACISKKVSRRTLTGSVLGVLAVLAIFIVYGMRASAEEKDKRQENTTSIQVMKTSLEEIKGHTERVAKNQEVLMRERVTKENLIGIMIEAIRRSKE